MVLLLGLLEFQSITVEVYRLRVPNCEWRNSDVFWVRNLFAGVIGREQVFHILV
jgi:hypothetical protein